jgi:biotin carboxylase
MNFVFLSPSFPANYYLFCAALKKEGVNVLGIGEPSFGELRTELRESLAWYCQVGDLRDRAQVGGAMRFLSGRFGTIDRIDSLNEYWLETEAQLRTEFGISGIQAADVAGVRRKSLMKKVFALAGIPHARGRLVSDARQAHELAGELNFPIVVKPDDGMGAEFTYRLNSPLDLDRFLDGKPNRDFIMEEFIDGGIVTFDGLAGPDGGIVFCTSHVYGQGVMEAVLADMHISYYSLREIPPDIMAAGQKLVKGFNVRERFFHFEFFRRPDGTLCALEVNIRPPGGMTMDMFNYACDIDMYSVWERMMAGENTRLDYRRKYHCCYAGRKYRLNYRYSHQEILNMLGPMVVHHQELPPVLARAMGDRGYLLRAETPASILEAVGLIQAEK